MKKPQPPVPAVLKPPAAPLPLPRLPAQKARLESERQVSFEMWKAALLAHDGNVMRAARATLVEQTEGKPRGTAIRRAESRGKRLTRVLGLAGYAGELRVASGVKQFGRPYPGKSKNKGSKP